MRICKQYTITFAAVCALVVGWLTASLTAYGGPRVIEILADKDSHYKIAGQNKPQLALKAGEQILLRIDARKSRTWSRDGSVHGFTMMRVKDHARVPSWDFELRPGMNEFPVTAPAEPGEYEVMCTVICSGDHEGMRMKVVVAP